MWLRGAPRPSRLCDPSGQARANGAWNASKWRSKHQSSINWHCSKKGSNLSQRCPLVCSMHYLHDTKSRPPIMQVRGCRDLSQVLKFQGGQHWGQVATSSQAHNHLKSLRAASSPHMDSGRMENSLFLFWAVTPGLLLQGWLKNHKIICRKHFCVIQTAFQRSNSRQTRSVLLLISIRDEGRTLELLLTPVYLHNTTPKKYILIIIYISTQSQCFVHWYTLPFP